MSGGEVRYFFKSSKTFWHLSVHSKFCPFLKVLKNMRPLSVEREITRLRAARHPLSCWICFTVLGGGILIIASISVGLNSMPLWEIIYPRNFPPGSSSVAKHLRRFFFFRPILRNTSPIWYSLSSLR